MNIKLICFIAIICVDSAIGISGICDCLQQNNPPQDEIEEYFYQFNTCQDIIGQYPYLPAPPPQREAPPQGREMELIKRHLSEINFPEDKYNDLMCCVGKAYGMVGFDNKINSTFIKGGINRAYSNLELQDTFSRAVDTCTGDLNNSCNMLDFHKCCLDFCVKERCLN